MKSFMLKINKILHYLLSFDLLVTILLYHMTNIQSLLFFFPCLQKQKVTAFLVTRYTKYAMVK